MSSAMVLCIKVVSHLQFGSVVEAANKSDAHTYACIQLQMLNVDASWHAYICAYSRHALP